MALKVDDRWLWLGLGIFTFVAIRGISYGLHEVVRLTEIHEPPEETQRLSQETEDAIKLESLHVLAQSQNLDIRNAAVKILCHRFIQHPTAASHLHADLASPSAGVRARAGAAIQLLERHSAFGGAGPWRLDLPELPGLPAARSRLREESAEEQALRRRRREAMVLSEGPAPLSQRDIIEAGGARGAEEREREMLREIEEGLRRELGALGRAGGAGVVLVDGALAEQVAEEV